MQRLSLLKKTRPSSIAVDETASMPIVPVHNAIRRVSLDLSKDHMRGISARKKEESLKLIKKEEAAEPRVTEQAFTRLIRGDIDCIKNPSVKTKKDVLIRELKSFS